MPATTTVAKETALACSETNGHVGTFQCLHRVVLPGNLSFGYKVWIVTKFL